MRAHQNPWGRVSQVQNQVKEETTGSDAFIVFGVLAQMPAGAQTNDGGSNMHVQWFSCWKIRADDHDVIS